MTMLRPVYPRWRGEYNNQVSSNSQQRGLSPLARGIHNIVSVGGKTGRFIPAGAGNTLNVCHCL
ncbi:hypothetical protein [Salmonella enterica subsp. enterica serovar Bredeney]|nr:hypothetical protein [Salmonella enterica subsp. enterica serovar Bredeney]